VGPVKLVAAQSQMNLFQPSVHTPPFMQGCESHWGNWTWHDERIAPVTQHALNEGAVNDWYLSQNGNYCDFLAQRP
jgi:hypothetical protein